MEDAEGAGLGVYSIEISNETVNVEVSAAVNLQQTGPDTPRVLRGFAWASEVG